MTMFILSSRSNGSEEIMRQMPADSAEMLLAMERKFPNFDWNCHYRLVDHMMICKPKEVTIPPPPPPPTLSIHLSHQFLEMDSAAE